ncbi:MAG: hypothetical protein FWD28_11160, partial [Treponema sp.]|nr:hypothetical protein [Treponema sp.]
MRSKYLFLIIIFFLFIFSCSNPILTDLLEPLFPEECKICIVTNTATCTTSGLETRVCSKYKQHEGTRNVNALGHDYSDLTQTTPPTCIARGIKTGTC